MITIITAKRYYTQQKANPNKKSYYLHLENNFDRDVSLSNCFVSFEVTFLLIFFSLSSKYVFVIMSLKSVLVPSFAYFNCLSFIIYLSRLGISFNFFNVCVIVSFFKLTSVASTKLTFLTKLSYSVFLSTYVFTTSLALLKPIGKV